MTENTELTCINCAKRVVRSRIQLTCLEATVASDCRPQPWPAQLWQCPHCQQIQKIPDRAYQQNVEAIYRSYTANPLTQGAEQLNYSSAVPLPRCQQILHNAQPNLSQWADASINVLDIGTGSGVMLDAVHEKYPAWQLYAHDVSDHQAECLRAKLPLQGFMAGELNPHMTKPYQQHFQLISMIHVVEHVLNPQALLSQLATLLADDGVLLIQVPHILENPWDLGIYDHVQHFQPETLIRLVQQVFPVTEVMASPIQKEITLVAKKHSQRTVSVPVSSCDAATYPTPLLSIVDELQRLRLQLEQATVSVLLGTGPAAGMLLSSAKQWQLDHKITAIVDEDERKWGSEFGGVRVISPAEIPKNADVLLPYPEAQRAQIQKRLVDVQ